MHIHIPRCVLLPPVEVETQVDLCDLNGLLGVVASDSFGQELDYRPPRSEIPVSGLQSTRFPSQKGGRGRGRRRKSPGAEQDVSRSRRKLSISFAQELRTQQDSASVRWSWRESTKDGGGLGLEGKKKSRERGRNAGVQ